MSGTNRLTGWLAENPKMMGALWMGLLVLGACGNASAGGGVAIVGP